MMLSFKQGDTFLLSCTYMVDGVPAALPSVVRSQLRDAAGNLIQELTFNPGADLGTYTLGATPAETAAWPQGVLNCDIQYGDDPRYSTPTFQVFVAKDITHD